jgi:hypothetical protein
MYKEDDKTFKVYKQVSKTLALLLKEECQSRESQSMLGHNLAQFPSKPDSLLFVKMTSEDHMQYLQRFSNCSEMP